MHTHIDFPLTQENYFVFLLLDLDSFSVPIKENLLLIFLLTRGLNFTLLSHEDSNLDRQNQKL